VTTGDDLAFELLEMAVEMIERMQPRSLAAWLSLPRSGLGQAGVVPESEVAACTPWSSAEDMLRVRAKINPVVACVDITCRHSLPQNFDQVHRFLASRPAGHRRCS
jgi:hypothetical protein